MTEQIKAAHIPHPSSVLPDAAHAFLPQRAQEVHAFHSTFPEYTPTPLLELDNLAAALGIEKIFVKDESLRFGLNAFKVLGGSYCIGRYIASRLGLDPSKLSYNMLTVDRVRRQLGKLTFVTATDGNHGRGIAWTAARLGHSSVVYMPYGSSPERLKNIRELGAEASITKLNYDEAVRFARDMAKKNGWILVQDTSWTGYEEIPRWIMQGYTTMALEIVNQLHGQKPTHIFLQAGVGAMAGALSGFFASYYGVKCRPRVIIVEPEQANCIFRTASANDGRLHSVGGPLDTMMAGLACGEPCSIGWEVLSKCADDFFSVPDNVAAVGMRMLASPLSGDSAIVSGESGAVTIGLAAQLLTDKALSEHRISLGLDKHSSILCISTEGNTDSENYQKIVSV